MKIFPAIDLYEGKVVRLTQGDYGRRREYALSPLEAALAFRDAGCPRIHVVDLEGAEAGEPRNLSALSQIAELGLFVQYGGGLRDEAAVAGAIEAGASRVMAGSLIFRDMERAPRLAERFGGRIMAAVDVKGGRVVHSGWLETTDLTPELAVERLSAVGFTAFLVTETERDGMMAGTEPSLYGRLAAPGRFICAAGGVTAAADIRALAKAGAGAAVIGKSLYEGGITLEEALAAANEAATDDKMGKK